MNAQRTIIKDLIWIAAMLVITGFLRFSAGSLAFIENKLWLIALFTTAMYTVMALTIVSTLGHCPLKWRRLSFWTLVIMITHAYWVEFLLHFLISPAKAFYWLLIFAGIGSLAGIWLRLHQSYRKCDCNSNGNPLHDITMNNDFQPFTGIPGIPAFITHHPSMPGIISKVFSWKPMLMRPTPDLQLSLVCTGKSLVSLPHFSYGALFVRNGSNNPDQTIVAHLHQLHFDRGFSGIEYRHPVLTQDENAVKVVSWLPLKGSVEEQRKGFSSNLRRKINKAARNHLVVERGGMNLLNDYYKVYARHIRSIGSGALPRRFFETMLKDYDHAWTGIFLVRYQGKVIGGAFNHAYRGFYENGWFATLQPWQRLYPSYILHSEMIAHAVELGCHTYSFGQSTRGSGVHLFKQQWKTYDVALRWLVYPQPSVNLRKLDWIRKIWKHLPYPVGNKFGNYIAKWVY